MPAVPVSTVRLPQKTDTQQREHAHPRSVALGRQLTHLLRVLREEEERKRKRRAEELAQQLGSPAHFD